MAGNMKLALEIFAKGGDRTIQELLALQAALNKTAKEAGGITLLANALGGTSAQAQKLTQATGLTAEKAAAAVLKLKELNAVSADTFSKFAVLNKELGISAQQFEQLEQAVNNTQQGMGAVAAVSGAIAGSIGATFAASSKQFADFEKELTSFGVVTESLNSQAFTEVRQEVERLAASTSKSPQEIAALATELGRAGFTAQQTKEALAGIVQSSEATGEGLVRTGEVIGAAINQFGLAATDSTKIADLLTQASNVSAAGTADLGEALSYVGSQAKASDQSLEDTVTTLALLANAGIKGSSAGTGLAEALRRVKVASATASTELDELKGRGSKAAVEAFNKLNGEVRNADGSLKPFPEILKTVKSSLATLEQGDQDLLMNALFGVQGGRVIQSLLVQSDESVKQVTDSMQRFEGSASKASAQMQQGLGPSLKVLEGSAQLAGIKLGEVVSVGIIPLVQGATTLINTFLGLPGPVQAALIATTGLVGALAAAVAVIAAYNLANGARIVAEAKAASATLISTGTLVTQKAVMLATIAVQAALTAGRIALAVATGNFAAAQALATAVMAAATPVAAGLLAALSAALPVVIALAGAFAIFKTAQYAAGLVEANNQLETLSKNSTASSNEFAKIAGKVKGLNSAFKETGKFTTEQQKLAQGYLKVSKDKIKSLEDEIAAAKAIQPANEEQKTAQQAAIAGLEAQKRALTNQTAELEKNLAAQKSNNAARRQGSKDSRKSKEEIEAEIEALKKRREAEKEAAQRQFDDREKATSRSNDDAREKRQRAAEDAKAARERAFEQEKQSAQEAFQDAKAAREKAFQAQQEQQQKLFRNRLEKEQQSFAQKQRAAEERFEQEKQRKEQQFSDRQKVADDQFKTAQQQRAAAFQKQQQQAETEFQRQLEDRKKSQDKSFTEAEKLAAAQGNSKAMRQLEEEQRRQQQISQLNLSNQIFSPQQILELARQIAGTSNKEIVASTIRQIQEEQQRQQVNADRQQTDQFKQGQEAEKQEFEAKQQEERRAFEAQQREEERAFRQEQRDQEKAFKASQQEAEKSFQQSQRQQEEAFKQSQRQQEEAFKQSELEKERVFKDQQQQKEAQFKQAELEKERQRKEQEKQIQRQEEDARLQRERAFKDEQRKLDELNQQKIEALKKESDNAQKAAAGKQEQAAQKQQDAAQKQLEAANKRPPTPPGRRYGGPVKAGQLYEVGESGRELFVPASNGYILSHPEANRIARQVLTAQQLPLTLTPLSSTFPRPAATASLEKQFELLQRELRRLGDATYRLAYTPRNLTISSPTPQTDAIRYSRELQRQMLVDRGV